MGPKVAPSLALNTRTQYNTDCTERQDSMWASFLSEQLSRASNSPRVKQRHVGGMGPAMQLRGHWCAFHGKLHWIVQASCRPVLLVLLCMLLLVLCMLLLLCVMLLLCMLVLLLVGQTH